MTASVGGILTGIETIGMINGTNFGDNITAGVVVVGGGPSVAGDDRLTGSSAADTIYGGTGNDRITGGWSGYADRQ